MVKKYLLLLFGLLAGSAALFSCRQGGTQGSPSDLSQRKLPPDCQQAIDTLVGAGGAQGPVDTAHKVFRALVARYPYKRDSLVHASLMAWWSQIWYTSREADSMQHCCNEALFYFNAHPEFIDLRAMCYLYLGWSHFFKEEVYTANGFFNKMGNELTDTVYLPGSREPVTSEYPAEVKAALFEEIANIARLSGMKEQALRYIRLSLQQGRLAVATHPDIYGFILLEAGTTYQSLDRMDSARYFFAEAARVNLSLHDTSLLQPTLYQQGYFLLKNGRTDSSIGLFRQLLALPLAPASVDSGALFGAWLGLAEAYTLKDRLDSADYFFSLYQHNYPGLQEDPDLMTTFLGPYLEYWFRKEQAPRSREVFRQYARLRQQTFDHQRVLSINDMDAQYDLRRKEGHIGRLSEANERYAARQERLFQFVLLGVLLLAAGGIIIWQRQARRRLLAEKEKIEMEQRLLRSQMEPHFIFNTLSVLQGLIRSDQKEQSVSYLNRFARLLRTSLENSRESLVPLSEELQALDDYLSLQQVRFPGRFDYRIEDPGEPAEEILIPPMLLQPFVENAIRYGLPPVKERKGLILVTARADKDMLYCRISDNGPGANGGTGEHAHGRKSLATLITRERLAILSRQSRRPAGLEIQAGTGGRGTEVLISIPIAPAGPDE